MSPFHIAQAWNVDCESNDIIDIDVVHLMGIYWHIDDYFSTFFKEDAVVQQLFDGGTRCWFMAKSS